MKQLCVIIFHLLWVFSTSVVLAGVEPCILEVKLSSHNRSLNGQEVASLKEKLSEYFLQRSDFQVTQKVDKADYSLNLKIFTRRDYHNYSKKNAATTLSLRDRKNSKLIIYAQGQGRASRFQERAWGVENSFSSMKRALQEIQSCAQLHNLSKGL